MEMIDLEHNNAIHRRTQNVNNNVAKANEYWNKVSVLLIWKTGLHNSSRKKTHFVSWNRIFLLAISSFFAFQRWYVELEVEAPINNFNPSKWSKGEDLTKCSVVRVMIGDGHNSTLVA
jgi:hypothetical protein